MDLVKFVKDAMLAMALFGGAVWFGTVWGAEGPEELENACMPISIVADVQHRLISTIIGYESEWTIKAQRTLTTHCYYAVRYMELSLTRNSDPIGGVRYH